MPTTPERPRPTGRRPGDSGTRDAILDAALALFAERGYDGASVRAIAAAAGVDPGLVRHFYGDKETLFATAVAVRSTIPAQVGAAWVATEGVARDDVGRAVTDAYLRMWAAPATGAIMLALVRSATTSDAAAHMVTEASARMLRTALGVPDDPEASADPVRARGIALAVAHLLGVAVARHVVHMGPIVALTHDELVEQVAPSVQRYLTGG